jgi:hypothetical protein
LAAHLKRFFGRCADAMAAAGDARGAERLRSASTHWLRHTHTLHARAFAAPLHLAPQHVGQRPIVTAPALESEHALTSMSASCVG